MVPLIVLVERAKVGNRTLYESLDAYRSHFESRLIISATADARIRSIIPEGVPYYPAALLAHHHIRDWWIRSEAEKAASLMVKVVPKPCIILCCGGRLMSAFRPYYSRRPDHQGIGTTANRITYVRIPSLSHRNAQWDSPEIISKCKDRFFHEYNAWLRDNA